jgi:hypothetical protein
MVVDAGGMIGGDRPRSEAAFQKNRRSFSCRQNL